MYNVYCTLYIVQCTLWEVHLSIWEATEYIYSTLYSIRIKYVCSTYTVLRRTLHNTARCTYPGWRGYPVCGEYCHVGIGMGMVKGWRWGRGRFDAPFSTNSIIITNLFCVIYARQPYKKGVWGIGVGRGRLGLWVGVGVGVCVGYG